MPSGGCGEGQEGDAAQKRSSCLVLSGLPFAYEAAGGLWG